MKSPNKVCPLDLYTLRFSNNELSKGFEQYQSRNYSQSQLFLVMTFISQLIICGMLFIISNFSYSIIPLILLNLIATVLQAALSSYRFYLNQVAYLISSGSVVVTLILMSSLAYEEDFISDYKDDLYFAGGLSLLLLNSIFSTQWFLKIISITVSAIIFIIFFELRVVASIITCVILCIFALNIYRSEKNYRIQFLTLQRKKQSLQNWEKFLDANYQDPVFIIDINMPNSNNSNNKQRPSIDKVNYKSYQNDYGNEEVRMGKVQADAGSAIMMEQIKGFNMQDEYTQDKKQRIPQISSIGIKNNDFDVFKQDKKLSSNSKSNHKMIIQSQMMDDACDEQTVNFSQKIMKLPNQSLTQNKFSQNQLDQQKYSLEEERLHLKFQNIACQKEFYQKVNQAEYFQQEMQKLIVHLPIELAIELQFSQELAQQNIEKPRSVGNFQFLYGKGSNNLNPFLFSYNQSASSNQMVSSSRLQEFDYKNPKKYYNSSLYEFLQKKIWFFKTSQMNQGSSNQKNETKLDWSMIDDNEEDRDYFEATEISLLENCERKVSAGLGYQTKYYNIQLYKCVYKGNSSIMGIIKDLTDQQKNLQQRYMELSKEKLILSLVHELNAPLNKLMNCIDALADKRINHEHATDVAKQNCMQASLIVSDIIDYFRIVNASLELKRTSFTVNQLQHEISKVFEEQMKERCINFQFDCQMDPHDKIVSDYQRIKQIIVNLMSLALKYTTEGDITVSMSYYDTKKETIEFVVSHTESFLSKEIIEQLRSSFQNFDHKYDIFTSGKNLQLLLCQGLIEKIGPSQFFVKQDEGYVEIRFKIYSNHQQAFKQIDSRTNFISFNRENNQAFFEHYNKKSQTRIEPSASQVFKKNSTSSNTNLDLLPSGQGVQSTKNIQQLYPSARNINQYQQQKRHSGGSPVDYILGSGTKTQSPIQHQPIRNHQPSLQLMLSQQTQPINTNFNQQPQSMFESACLLTEEIGEKRDFNNDQQVHYISRDYKLKSKYDIETTNTMSKIRSTADTFEMDFLEDLKRFLSYSRILIVDDEKEYTDSLVQLLQTKVHELEIHRADNSRMALQKIIDAENDSFQYSNSDLNYRLIIMSVNTKTGDTFNEVKKMKKYISQSPNIPITPIILVSKEHNESHLSLADEAGALALIFHPLSLENLSQCLKKFNKIQSLNQIQI